MGLSCSAPGLSSCGSWTLVHRLQELRGTGDLPRRGLEAVCPALAGRFVTTEPAERPAGKLLIQSLLRFAFQIISLCLISCSLWISNVLPLDLTLASKEHTLIWAWHPTTAGMNKDSGLVCVCERERERERQREREAGCWGAGALEGSVIRMLS